MRAEAKMPGAPGAGVAGVTRWEGGTGIVGAVLSPTLGAADELDPECDTMRSTIAATKRAAIPDAAAIAHMGTGGTAKACAVCVL